MELVLIAKDGHQINEPKILKEIEQLTSYLSTVPSISAIFSPCTFYKTIYDAQSGPMLSQYQLPEKTTTFNAIEKLSKRFQNPFVNSDLNKGLITIRMTDVGRLKVQEIINTTNDWVNRNFVDRQFEMRFTGKHALIDRTNELMINSMFEGLLLALVLISLIIGFLFKSIKLTFISLVPNIFPLILTGGMMGFLGIELNGSSAIIFTIAFVIAVDDTIHFLSKYKLSRNNGKSVEDSLHITFLETGKAICLTSLILFFGFLVMLFSTHPPSVNIGLLISLTLVSAIVSDLFLIPPMIRWLDKDEVEELANTPLRIET